ncbi:hypothetical protein QTP88_028462 [Uroleucon formosanum]
MFADDLKLLRKIESEADCLALQNELDSISLWFSTLGLQFNTYKCKAMFFTKRRLVFDYSYTINGSVIDRVASNSDLGVLFTADLNFRPHIDSICCRALKSLGFVMRTMNEFKLFGSLKTVYCSLVRSMLEYASVLWDPFVNYTNTNITNKENYYKFAIFFIGIQLSLQYDKYINIKKHIDGKS